MSILLLVFGSLAAMMVVLFGCIRVGERLAGGPLIKHNPQTGNILVHDYMPAAMIAGMFLGVLAGVGVAALGASLGYMH